MCIEGGQERCGMLHDHCHTISELVDGEEEGHGHVGVATIGCARFRAGTSPLSLLPSSAPTNIAIATTCKV